LTRQLLAFSRRQVIQPVVVSLNTIVSETETLLRRLIEKMWNLSPDSRQSRLVEADPGQVQQIIMNLAINSRDAMPNGAVCLSNQQL